MELVRNEDQEFIARTAADFVREKSPVDRVRALRDANDEVGFSRELWKEMAALGWTGMIIPERLGGAGLGFSELTPVLEELGRSLVPEPFLSTVLLGGQALLLSGASAQAEAWLPKICSGDAVLALAFQERRSRYDLAHCETTAHKKDGGYVLEGEKVQVLDGMAADAFVVSARSEEGLALFLLPGQAEGLALTRQQRLDSRGAALLRLAGVRAPEAAMLARPGEGEALLSRVVDLACIGLCAEMLGGMQQAFELGIEHLKTRKQFDVPIGSFQALKHRAADLFIEIELCKSLVLAAACAADAGAGNLPRLVSATKVKCSDTFVLAGNEGVQWFGGVGMTDEYDIGLYLKRARATELTFGDAAYHRNRWAALAGY